MHFSASFDLQALAVAVCSRTFSMLSLAFSLAMALPLE
ncbi:hypothetical protein HPHPP1_1678 [Helicobacter pylori Hp P-1]|nr:hypothetical protein HPHPP1_1678 [Helicobacter pylori Hp P-1]